MESIERLRTAARNMAKGRNLEHHEECNLLLRIADQIEAEIVERYMELPVDAEGVPIHCGDRMRLDNGHEGEVWLIGAQDIMMSDHTCFDWARSRHVKPRTIEDVLREFGAEFDDYDDVWLNEKVAEYADEIRGLL